MSPMPEGVAYCSHLLLTNFPSEMTSKQQS